MVTRFVSFSPPGPRPLLPWARSLSPVFSHLPWTPGSGPARALGSTTGAGLCPFSPSVGPLMESRARSLAPPAVAFRPRVPRLLWDWAQPPSVSQALSHLFQSPIPPSFTKVRSVLREPVCGSASRDAPGGVDGPPRALGSAPPRQPLLCRARPRAGLACGTTDRLVSTFSLGRMSLRVVVLLGVSGTGGRGPSTAQ